MVLHEVSWHREELRRQLLTSWAVSQATVAAACMEVATRVLCPAQAIRTEIVDAYGIESRLVDVVPYGSVDVRSAPPATTAGQSLLELEVAHPAPTCFSWARCSQGRISPFFVTPWLDS